MKRPSPLVQMTVALVALCNTLVLLGSMFLNTMPDRRALDMSLRKSISEALAVQMAEMLRRDDPREIEKSMAAIVARTAGLRSIGVRRSDGTLVLQAGPHERHWKLGDDERSRPEQVTVPLQAEGQRWGRFEAAFAADDASLVTSILREPLVQMLLFVSVAGWLVFGLYLRRALQHLDPSSVVPERVQVAFDAMAEGVVVLDARGRMMLTNKAFRGLHPELAAVRTGSSLSSLPWLAASLPADAAQHPWTLAMSQRAPNAGTALEAGHADERRQLVINAAPIADVGGAVRGCMVTFDDMTALHLANETLRAALGDLALSKQEVEAKNLELEQLATRDPLTGALNRRAFHIALETAQRKALADGSQLSCLMVDIDHFKSINDNHGHGVGDRVIQEVARKLQESARATDLVCRWGGEEFCLVVVGLDARTSLEFAERVRMRIERECGAGMREMPQGLVVTASIGLAMMSPQLTTPLALIDHADEALYRAKRSGRNRIATDSPPSCASEPLPSHQDPESGCLNAEGLASALVSMRQAARAEDRVLGCVIFAIDDVEALVARHGEPALAAASLWLAETVRRTAPGDAAVARLDQGRACAVLPRCGLADCESLAEHVRKLSERQLADLCAGAPAGSVTVSAGVDALSASASGAAMLYERTEQALGRARRAGANSVTLFAPAREGPAAGTKLTDGRA